MVIILGRHGVRSPTWAQARLDRYSAQPWPAWSVPPGNLTSRGYELVKQFGSFDRASLAETGLLATQGCEDATKTYIWADTDQRTIASGKALAEGVFPGCPPQVHSLAERTNDPLFHPAAKPADSDASSKTTKGAGQQTPTQQHELLDEMQHVLLGCDPKLACSPARKPALPLFPVASDAAQGAPGDSPLALASSFAEDFLLEYADGMPMNEVGWGKVDEPQLRSFLILHSDYFDRVYRTPAFARLQASNMLFHIERTLEQAVERKPVDAAIGPTGSKLVILAGHDTNIAEVAALLGLHWTLDGRTDDTPPGMQLLFELWQDEHGNNSVRISAEMQTIKQLREMRPLTPTAPPASEALMLPGCAVSRGACSWPDFQRIADLAVEKDAVIATRPN
jgi:4-phytase/acid phosphatase